MPTSTTVLPIQQAAQTNLESLVRGVDFSSYLSSGETLSSITVTATCYSGNVDPNPKAILSGPPTISPTQALQRIAGGLPGSAYRLAFVVHTSLGNTFEGLVYFWVSQG